MNNIRLRKKSTILLLALCLSLPTNLSAHEYWLEPKTYQPKDGKLVGYLHNGQNFKGAAFPFVAGKFKQFNITNSGKVVDVTNRTGNSPALDQEALGDGLNIISFQNHFDDLTFKDWDEFKTYLENEGLEHIEERHLSRGLPKTDFVEQYARCAKALIRIGDEEGKDQQTGLQIEFVAHQDPYSLNIGDTLRLTLYWEGEPLPYRKVNLFTNDGELKKRAFYTDASGDVAVPLFSGGKYLLNAVEMIEGDNDPETEIAEWQSYWASLVFGINGTDQVLLNASKDK